MLGVINVDATASTVECDELLKLDNQLCFVLAAASRAMTRLYRPLLDKHGLTYPQYLVLLAMWQWLLEEPDKMVLVKELGERLSLDSGTLTPLLKRMERNGLITRSRSVDDERSIIIRLTSKAIAMKVGVAEVPRAMLCSTAIPLNELGSLKSRMDELLQHLQGSRLDNS